mmetsp:Transcript_5566/g.18498  ORF Transcript_5566/g.18498 Transcript_5566/m.18498 type:complete len:424 (-) Transcript_5566:6348-7619(-)
MFTGCEGCAFAPSQRPWPRRGGVLARYSPAPVAALCADLGIGRIEPRGNLPNGNGEVGHVALQPPERGAASARALSGVRVDAERVEHLEQVGLEPEDLHGSVLEPLPRCVVVSLVSWRGISQRVERLGGHAGRGGAPRPGNGGARADTCPSGIGRRVGRRHAAACCDGGLRRWQQIALKQPGVVGQAKVQPVGEEHRVEVAAVAQAERPGAGGDQVVQPAHVEFELPDDLGLFVPRGERDALAGAGVGVRHDCNEQVEQHDLDEHHQQLVDQQLDRDDLVLPVRVAGIDAEEVDAVHRRPSEVHVVVVGPHVERHAPRHEDGRDGIGEVNVARADKEVEGKGKGDDGDSEQQQEGEHVGRQNLDKHRDQRADAEGSAGVPEYLDAAEQARRCEEHAEHVAEGRLRRVVRRSPRTGCQHEAIDS